MNRDPIGEKGGVAVYAFCQLDPLSRFDPDGRASGTALPENFWEHVLREVYGDNFPKKPDSDGPGGDGAATAIDWATKGMDVWGAKAQAMASGAAGGGAAWVSALSTGVLTIGYGFTVGVMQAKLTKVANQMAICGDYINCRFKQGKGPGGIDNLLLVKKAKEKYRFAVKSCLKT